MKKPKKESYMRDVVQKFSRHKLAMIGLCVFMLEIILVIVLPPLLGLDPYTSHNGYFGAGPDASHILGCDDVGRDLFARLVYGGRTSLIVGVISVIISLCLGLPLGLLAGYYRGAWEVLVMRAADVFMSFPSMVLILVLVSVVGPSITSVTVVIGIMGWPSFARLLYSRVLVVREQEYVEAARAVGTGNVVTMVRYILPNAFAPVLVQVTFRCASSILQEASLSFLGYGVLPPAASWGNILYAVQSISVLSMKPWVWIPPGILLIITVLSINFIGDGLRDALDPKMKVGINAG